MKKQGGRWQVHIVGERIVKWEIHWYDGARKVVHVPGTCSEALVTLDEK